jgi:uracil-DNA glycosylase family 4
MTLNEGKLRELQIRNEKIVGCRLCPRLVEWREEIGRVKRKSFADWDYWARPVPDFGDPEATRLIVGLAPAAHGANRTGLMFHGDRSGDWLYRAMHKAGLAKLPKADSREDRQELFGVLISATCHCAPPDNKPTPQEISACKPFLDEILLGRQWSSILCLGALAWENVLKALSAPKVKFGHGSEVQLENGCLLLASFHPSQQNTFTGKLTEDMIDEVMARFAAQ